VRGEVRLNLFNAESDLLLDVDEVLVRLPDGKEHEVSIDHARRADKTILLKLHSIDDRDRAEEIRGATICVPREKFPPLEDGEFYACDVEGAEVRLQNARIGVVERLEEYPTTHALVVKKDDGALIEVPLTEAYVEKVDTAARVVLLATIEDL
jgi:16S rRNA processing protein RimM